MVLFFKSHAIIGMLNCVFVLRKGMNELFGSISEKKQHGKPY